ncbi:hypothetical protein [Companilactobacillus sp. DQM5]|uniref:hypothetical protein n=1 Tax=Companilactobacillus sp. DQM5 TaxID=3463359 RepID=UPI004057E4FE
MNIQIELINFLNKQKNNLVFEPKVYSNQLTVAFANQLIPDNLQSIFPKMRLHVERIDDNILPKIKSDLNIFTDKLNKEEKNFQNVWLTTSNISDRKLALVEISFE